MLATFEFVIGLILGYLIISPRFRGLLAKTVTSWKPPKKVHADADGYVDVTYKLRETSNCIQPVPPKEPKVPQGKPIGFGEKRGAQMSEKEFENLLEKNPELKARIGESS